MVIIIYMDNYPDWQQYKLYEGHLRRLKQIDRRGQTFKQMKTPRKKQQNSIFKENSGQKQDLSKEKQKPKLARIKTEPNLKPSASNSIIRLPPPGSETDGYLMKSALSCKKISMRDKEKLLENYLLSKRIIKTKPVIKQEEFKKEFRIHKKISENMSRSRSNSTYSKKRSESNFLIIKLVVGQGKNVLEFKITEILLIKGMITKNDKVLYNLKVKVGKYTSQLKALSYESIFNNTIKIRFKKSILVSNPEIIIFLSMLRQNSEIEVGIFKPVIKSFHQKKKEVYKITKGKFPIGTIQIQGVTIYFVKVTQQLL